MKIKAYAKINLALDVVAKREDGYHELEMIMAPISLHDLIYIKVIDKGIEIDSNSKIMPKDKKNIVYKIAKIMQERYNLEKGIKIYIYKHIPTQAGLAGGSADGAAVIKAINKLFNLNLTKEEMAKLGKEVGADIPFCIYNQTALVKGIGENLKLSPAYLKTKLLLVKPKKGVSTKKAFEKIRISSDKNDCQRMYDAIQTQDYTTVVNCLKNTLEEPSTKMVPDILKIKEEMLELGFDGALMSGSGSCVFGLSQSEEIIEKGYQYFKSKYRFVRKSEIIN